MLIGRLGLAKPKANTTISVKDMNKSSFATKKTPVSQRFYRATVCMSDASLPHAHKQPPTREKEKGGNHVNNKKHQHQEANERHNDNDDDDDDDGDDDDGDDRDDARNNNEMVVEAESKRGKGRDRIAEVAAGGSDSRAVRALAIEAASAREELRRSEKHRAHSTARCRELESKCAVLEKDANELKYSNTQLRKELQATGEAAASAAARNRSALGVLRSGLAAVEETVARRSALGFQHLQAVFASLQQLQGLLLSPAVALSVPAASAQARSVLSESFSRLSALSNALGGQPDTVRGDPPALLTASERNNNNNVWVGVEGGHAAHGQGNVAERKLAEMEREKGRLATQLAEAQAELARFREGAGGNSNNYNNSSSARSGNNNSLEAAAAAQLLPQYRAALVRSRAQCAAMRERLAEAERARRAARQEMEMLQRLIRQRELEKVAEVSEVAKRAATEQHHQYSQDLQVLRQKLLHGDEAYRRLKLDHQALQVHAAELEETVEQLRATISELQVTVSEQRADIRAALEMVMSRRTRGGGGGVAGPNISRMMADILSSHISPSPLHDASHAMPTVAATMDDFLLHDDYNSGLPINDDFLLGLDLNSLTVKEPSSVPPAQFQQLNQNSGPVVLDTLQRDIAALDADITHLQASLESAAAANTNALRVD